MIDSSADTPSEQPLPGTQNKLEKTQGGAQDVSMSDERKYALASQASRLLDRYLSRRLLEFSDDDSGILLSAATKEARNDQINRLAPYISDVPEISGAAFEKLDPVLQAWERARRNWFERIEQIVDEAQRTSTRWSHSVQVACYCLVIFSAVVAVGFNPEWCVDPNVPIIGGFSIPFLRGESFGAAALVMFCFLLCVPFIRDYLVRRAIEQTRERLPRDICQTYGDPETLKVSPRKTLTRWYTRDSAIKLITPSFLIAVVGLLAAMVSIDGGLPKKGEDGYFIEWLPRVTTWLWSGRAELGMSIVLGLAAFLIEHVLGNLTLAKESLSASAENAKASSAAITEAQAKLEGLLATSIVTTSKTVSLARGFTKFDGILAVAAKVQELGAESWNIFHSKRSTTEKISLGIAQFVVSNRLGSMFEKFGELFSTISNLVDGRIKNEGEVSSRISQLYQANLLITAFESAVQSQDQLFKGAASNGQHFEVVAPFEALALTVNKFIEAVKNIPDDVKDGQNRISFYTLFPLRPTEFLKRASWKSRPDGGYGKPADEKAGDWIDFLDQLRSAKNSLDPIIIRHFLSIDEDLFVEIAEQYNDYVRDLYKRTRIEGGPPNANDPHSECGVKWNPLALESDRFTLLSKWVEYELNSLFVSPGGGEQFPWATSRQLVRRGDRRRHWRTNFTDEPTQGSIPLGKALYEYHAHDGQDGHGGALRVIEVKGAWDGARPAAGSVLAQILEPEDSEWVLVDYFAGRVRELDNDGKRADRWVFAIRSHFNPEMGVVKMRLHFAGPQVAEGAGPQQPDWDEVVANLDLLFGVGDSKNRSHIRVVDPKTGHLEPAESPPANSEEER